MQLSLLHSNKLLLVIPWKLKILWFLAKRVEDYFLKTLRLTTNQFPRLKTRGKLLLKSVIASNKPMVISTNPNSWSYFGGKTVLTKSFKFLKAGCSKSDFSSSIILEWKDTYHLLLRELLLLEKYSNISNFSMLPKDDVIPYMWTYFLNLEQQ